VTTDSDASVTKRFGAIELHDSILRGIAIDTGYDHPPDGAPAPTIRLDLKLFRAAAPKYWFEEAVLEFIDCTYSIIRADLSALAGVAFQIESNTCATNSALRREIEAIDSKTQENSLNGYTEFNLSLIAPGGNLTIFARDFVFRMQ
jgi:hypothetical protein